jgi:hypothetical protein
MQYYTQVFDHIPYSYTALTLLNDETEQRLKAVGIPHFALLRSRRIGCILRFLCSSISGASISWIFL